MPAKYSPEVLEQVESAKAQAKYQPRSEENLRYVANLTAKAQAKKNTGVYDSPQSAIESVIGTPSPEPVDYTIPIVSSGIGFLLGVLATAIFCRIQIKRIKNECEIRVTEARAALDRAISLFSQK